jgi:hypothetical protein
MPLLIRREYVYISCHKGYVVFVGEGLGNGRWSVQCGT